MPILSVMQPLGPPIRKDDSCLHYNLGTAKAFLYEVHFFIRWHSCVAGMRYPSEM